MASGPITSWQIHGERMEIVTDFIFWDSKITPDGGCSHEIKRCLLLGSKVRSKLESILKCRDTLAELKSRTTFRGLNPIASESVLTALKRRLLTLS